MDFNTEENTYEWLKAAKTYEQTLQSSTLPTLAQAENLERTGYCYDLASRQAKNVEEFRTLKQLSILAYEKAALHFGEPSTHEKVGKRNQCLSIAEYLRSSIASSSQLKQQSLDKCRDLSKIAIEAFQKNVDMPEIGKTDITLSECLFDRLYIVNNGQEAKSLSREGIDAANSAINAFSNLDNKKDDLLKAFSLASLHSWYAANISEQEVDAKTLANQSLSCFESALKLLQDTQNPYQKAVVLWAGTLSTLFFSNNIKASFDYAKEMFNQASTVKDNYFRGIACYLLAFVSDWMNSGEANPEKKKKRYEEILKYAEDAIQYLRIVNQDTPIAETYLFYVESYSCLAREFATTATEKLSFSRKAIETGENGLDYALRSGSLDALGSTLHALSKAYHYYSKLEHEKEEKQNQLRNALGFRKEYVSTVQKAFASNYWVLGVGLVYAGKIEADMAKLEEGENKVSLLQDAISDMSNGVTYCKSWAECRDVPSITAMVAEFEDAWGEMLDAGYLLTNERENLKKAIEVYGGAAEDFKKVDLPSRIAESYWKIAKNLDLLDEPDKAAECYEKSFAGYKAASQKICQFADFYLDYASYMKAWSEIENAKLAHNNEKYAAAMSHYEKTSNLLKQSKSWNYLSSNFYAWSLLEQAEDLSRKDNCKESVTAFEKSIKFLKESERLLRAELTRLDNADEQNLVKQLIQASNIRVEYGNGRIAIEEAKILNQQGNNIASSQKYESAGEIFKKIAQIDPLNAGKEARPLIYLCQAWQKMTMAEARNSPIMYEEAADLFTLANENSIKESTSLLAMGHSSFCKALEAGTEFEITRSTNMYEETSRYMSTAANYYLRAGFESASDYATATQRLFDAYVYVDSAKREKDPEKEAKFYMMAEKVLEIATEIFVKAGHIKKTEQVQRLLRKVKDDRELALSLSDVLHAPAVTASTASFSTIEPSEEKPVGLERFEHANIQAKIIQHGNEFKIGETFELEIQAINVGKETILMTKIENILTTGFQLITQPDFCTVEGKALLLKGSRLEPLKTKEIRLAGKSFIKGLVELKPRIVCIDEAGNQMTICLDPASFIFLEAALPGRVTTGYAPLDNLLLGGIPEKYAVILTSPSCDEKEELVQRYIRAGLTNSQVTFFITGEPGNAMSLAEEFQSNLFLFVCNPRTEVMAQNLPNVFKIRGIDSLTDLDIALTKAFRTLDPSRTGSKRVCIEIVSDVLLQHHAVLSRKWLSGLLPELRAKGFTTLAVINPQMHTQEEVQAILGLFEGEIRIIEKENEKGVEKTLRIRKLYNQRYIDSEIALSRETLEI